eukprot:310496-Chlamydomonas_euryale.AAC.1
MPRCDRSPTSSPWRASLLDVVPLNDGIGSERVSVRIYTDNSVPCIKSLSKIEINVQSPSLVAYYRGKFKARPTGRQAVGWFHQMVVPGGGIHAHFILQISAG